MSEMQLISVNDVSLIHPEKLKIGDEIFIHATVDEIRKGCIICSNEGGYFGTVPEEIFITARND